MLYSCVGFESQGEVLCIKGMESTKNAVCLGLLLLKDIGAALPSP